MPFTPSHAVVALPFLRAPLVPAAIAVRAMAPDLPLFLNVWELPYARTHSFAWLPVTTVLAFVLLLVWRCLLRPAVRELSPRWLARRLPPTWDAGAVSAARETLALRGRRDPSWMGVGLLAVALAFGVATHIAWDLFSHEGRAGVEALPLLSAQWGPFLGYKWVQYGSSALGLIVLAICAILWLRGADAAASVPRLLPAWVRWVWWVSLPVILVAALAIGYATHGPLTPQFTVQHLAYRVLPPACAMWGAMTVLACLLVPVVRAKTR